MKLFDTKIQEPASYNKMRIIIDDSRRVHEIFGNDYQNKGQDCNIFLRSFADAINFFSTFQLGTIDYTLVLDNDLGVGERTGASLLKYLNDVGLITNERNRPSSIIMLTNNPEARNKIGRICAEFLEVESYYLTYDSLHHRPFFIPYVSNVVYGTWREM